MDATGRTPRGARRRTASAGNRAVNPATAVIAGIVVLGLGNYVYLAVAARAVSVSDFARLSVVVTAIITVGPGVFFPFEQETGRTIASRLSIGASAHDALRSVVRFAGFVCVATVAVLALVGTATLNRLLDGDSALLLILIAGVAINMPVYLSRGALAGRGRLLSYGAQLAVDGTLRALVAGLLYAFGVESAWLYGTTLIFVPLLAVAITSRGLGDLLRRDDDRNDDRDDGVLPLPANDTGVGRVAHHVSALIVASCAMQLLANGGPVAVKLLEHGTGQDEAGRFLAAVVLARSPLFVVSAIQAALLPSLARLKAQGDLAAARRQLLLATLLVTGIGAVVVPAAAVVGPPLLALIYGPEYRSSSVVLLILAAGTIAYCVAVVVSIGLVAMRRSTKVAIGWVAGLATSVLALLIPLDPPDRVSCALLFGALVSAGYFALELRVALRHEASILATPTDNLEGEL